MNTTDGNKALYGLLALAVLILILLLSAPATLETGTKTIDLSAAI